MIDYGHDFYEDRHKNTFYSAKIILSIVAGILPAIKSAVDVGCGVGTWLSVLKENNITDILGIDGSWVEKELLEIPEYNFMQANLEEAVKVDRRFDLAISLEAAEHLHPGSAVKFVASLVGLSDFVLFSAAIPFQHGRHHINEQWPDYWAGLFEEHNYAVVDCIRKEIWNDKNIQIWYRQNILIFVKRERMKDLKNTTDTQGQYSALSIVHPDSYLRLVRQMNSPRGSWRLFRKSLRKGIKRKIKKVFNKALRKTA